MFAWKVKQELKDQARQLAEPNAQYSGSNRRAINLMPVPMMHDGHEIAQTSSIRYHHLLISIEGNQRTCCLKVISSRRKSRGALLIFRGRVLGSLYGRKNMTQQVMAQDAQQHVLSELATPGNILDAYQLPEDLVLASASLFQGQVLEFNRGTAEQVYEHAAHSIMTFGLPGCVVVTNTKEELVAMIYFAYGKMIGVYSSKDGWVENTHATVMDYLQGTSDLRITASVLAIRSIDEAANLGSSLTGLGDRRYDQWRRCDNLATRMPELEGHQLKALDQYETQPVYHTSRARDQATSGIQRKIQHVHAIAPRF